MRGSLESARATIEARLTAEPGGVFTEALLRGILEEHRGRWRIAPSVSGARFVTFLVERLALREVELRSKEYRQFRRYAWGEYSPFLMALSLRPRSYLSHGSAITLHGLNDQATKTIYANQEQSPKPSGGQLTQERLARAYSRRQRTSKYIYAMDNYRVVLLSGKQSGNLGVVKVQGPRDEDLPVTGIARTLIDIVVRPAYAGGIFQVLEAFRGAMGRVDPAEVALTLNQLDYSYPYHQAIGFLMARAGFSREECAPLKRLGTKFEFYLLHGMKNPTLNAEWRLLVPRGL